MTLWYWNKWCALASRALSSAVLLFESQDFGVPKLLNYRMVSSAANQTLRIETTSIYQHGTLCCPSIIQPRIQAALHRHRCTTLLLRKFSILLSQKYGKLGWCVPLTLRFRCPSSLYHLFTTTKNAPLPPPPPFELLSNVRQYAIWTASRRLLYVAKLTGMRWFPWRTPRNHGSKANLTALECCEIRNENFVSYQGTWTHFNKTRKLQVKFEKIFLDWPTLFVEFDNVIIVH